MRRDEDYTGERAERQMRNALIALTVGWCAYAFITFLRDMGVLFV